MKNWIRKIPILHLVARTLYHTFVAPFKSFPGTEEYWKQRYRKGGSSGVGSYSEFSEFKAEVLNGFVKEHAIKTIIEYGCGDGNQLKSAEYPSYTGFDVSPDALARCREIFADDSIKTFTLMNEYTDETAELTLSLDVIYHLIEDDVFASYMARLLDSSTQFVIIYSSDTDTQEDFRAAHVKQRKFSKWIEANRPEWKLKQHIPSKYPRAVVSKEGSAADFYIYEKS